VREIDSAAELTVADDGPGFPASIMPVTFERFVRPDSARGRVTGGTGLGLSIAATLARSQGATIEAGNESPLGGAWVRLLFPTDQPATATAEVRPDVVAPTG